jgi:hypothetical protein
MTVIIGSKSVLCVEKGDFLIFAAGIATVMVIAILANPQSISGFTAPVPVATPVPAPALTPLPIITPTYREVPPTPIPTDAPQYQIFYSDNPFSYPIFKVPENMETFGASDILRHNQDMVPFAFVEDKRGGLTQKFSIPYPLWVLNITVTANTSPQYGNFRMVLCYASNGTVIKGVEILNRGTAHRNIQTSNTDLYMIITTTSIDRYRITFETPRTYYDTYWPR